MTSSNKRERDLARQKYERQQQRRAQREVARRHRRRIIALGAGVAVALGAIVLFVVSSRSGSDVVASPTPSASTSSSTAAGACTTPPTPTTKTQTWSAPGGSALPTDKTTFLKLDTNCGAVIVSMDAKAAPKTTQSIAFLASQGYYTDSDCFRLTTSGIFVLQCGSPTNNGMGGPGYQIPDENLPANGTTGYPAGTVAMANSGANTNGSQFFIVYKDGSTFPGPDYSIWGKVVSGLDVLQKVAAAGVQSGGADGKPAQPFVITKATTSANALVG